MARIAIDAREINTSTGRYVERLLHYLPIIDKTNQYLVLLKPADYALWQPPSDNFQKINCPFKEFSFSEQLGFNQQLQHLEPDLVHFAMVQQPIFYRGKSVTTMHDLTTTRFSNPSKNHLIYWLKQRVYRFVNWYVPRKSRFVMTPSQFVKTDITATYHVRPTKIVVTHEAADEIDDPAEPMTDLQTKPFLLYVGRPQPHKNLARLIEAFSIIKQTQPDLLLVLAGRRDKTYDSYLKVASQLGVADAVIFTGYVTDGQLKWLYRSCRAYVFPSLSEGFGLPGLEAMVNRAPVVCSTASCLPEIYGRAAWYFNPLDVNDMVRSMNEVLTNQALRHQLIRAGRLQAAKYSWRRMAEQTLAVYMRALAK